MFGVCESVPYSVGSAWARDQIMDQLSTECTEVEIIKNTALIEELFIDPKTAAQRMTRPANVVPVTALDLQLVLPSKGRRRMEENSDN